MCVVLVCCSLQYSLWSEYTTWNIIQDVYSDKSFIHVTAHTQKVATILISNLEPGPIQKGGMSDPNLQETQRQLIAFNQFMLQTLLPTECSVSRLLPCLPASDTYSLCSPDSVSSTACLPWRGDRMCFVIDMYIVQGPCSRPSTFDRLWQGLALILVLLHTASPLVPYVGAYMFHLPRFSHKSQISADKMQWKHERYSSA